MKKRSSPRRMYDMASERSIAALLSFRKLKREQASTSKLPEQASTSKLPEQVGTSKLPEQASSGEGKATPSMSTKELAETELPQAEQERLKKLRRLREDSPKLKLLKRMDAGNLFVICHQHPEFRPLIGTMFQANEFLNPSWSRDEQELLVAHFKKIETLINELVSMKNNPDTSDDMEDEFERLLWYISEFVSILYTHMDTLHTENLRYAGFICTTQGREWLKARKQSDVDENIINELVRQKNYLATSIDTEFLIRIAHEHSEFRPSVKCALGVNSAMKYLDYNGQLKVYKVLIKVEEHLKQLIHQKYNPDLPHDVNVENTTENLIGSVNESFEEIMSNLAKQCAKSTKKFIECLKCPSVKSFVKSVNVKPQQWVIKEQDNPHRNLKGVVAYANYGISQDRLKNLESLFHHLAAKKGAFRHVWMYKNCVNWFEVALLYRQYRTKTRENREKLENLKNHILRRFDEYEEVMAGAREFSDRMHATSFPRTNNLSDEIALGGEMELLVSDAEDYLTTLDRLIRHFLDDWERYKTLNRSTRRNRSSFLTRHQWKAFDFPLY